MNRYTAHLFTMIPGDPNPPESGTTHSWPNAPSRQKVGPGAYFITASTYRKVHHFSGFRRLKALHDGLLKYAATHGWKMEAWAVFPNHYHFVACTAAPGEDFLERFFQDFHSRTARWVNQLDSTPGRQVWYNYFDTELSFQASYLARLKYVHFNAVHHGLVKVPGHYKWCSATWFETLGAPAHVRKVYNFKIDQLKIYDDF